MPTKNDFSETDLYPPIKKFFSVLEYDIKSEVKGCDITMTKNGELIIIELKKSFNMTLLFQAIERQKMTTQVYIGIPRPKKACDSNYKSMLYVLEKLGIGLITVAMDSPVKSVQIVSFPPAVAGVKNSRKRNSVLKEMEARTADGNLGGSRGKKLMTAFREKSIKIACALEAAGTATAKELVHTYGCDANAYRILRSDHHRWFIFLGKAGFTLSQEGKAMLDGIQFKEFIEYYRNDVKIWNNMT